MSFIEKLRRASEKTDSLVCVGLDTDMERIPPHLSDEEDGMYLFNEAIIRSTSDFVCAYKPNSAFYEALGSHGIEILCRTRKSIPSDIPVILDIKRGDIGNTALKYAEYAYDIIGADAVTVNPYMGYDTIKPFFREGKCVFVLCLSSNISAQEFQLLDTGRGMVFERVAEAAVEWAQEGEIGLVTGATYPEFLKRIRDIVGDMPLLIPGVGAQKGDIETVVRTCGGKAGSTIINSSREILYASRETDFDKAALNRLLHMRNEINRLRRHMT